jgi:hypothetical protein
MKLESLDPKMRMLLLCKPKRNEEVEWIEEEEKVVLIYPKNFTRFERFLHKRIGGPDSIKRPLDDKGTYIWKMCDGDHNVHDICTATYSEFKEDIEPVLKRVWGFLEILLKLNLITIDKPDKEKKDDDQDDKVKEDDDQDSKAKKDDDQDGKAKKDDDQDDKVKEDDDQDDMAKKDENKDSKIKDDNNIDKEIKDQNKGDNNGEKGD